MLFAMAAASAIPRGATAAGIHRRAQAAAAAALLATPTKAPPAGFSLGHGFVWSRRKAVVCPVVTRCPFALSHCSFSCRSSFLVEEWQGSRDANEVAVFWDLNNCAVPDELDPYRIGPNIVLALRTNGFSGPISIHAYGNTRSLNDQDFLQALVATGVDLHHVPGGMKDSNMHLLVGLLLWVKGNSPPAHMLLISGDKDFSSVMHKLHMRGYNVLWAHPEGEISPDLLSAASKVWAWDSIMKGVGLAARSCITGTSLKNDKRLRSQNVSHSSQGYSKPQVQNSQDIQPEQVMKKDPSNYDLKRKPQSIPKKVVEQVIDIIRLRPNGFTVAAFRRQLGRSNLILDKDFYGHKDLLSFLLSISKLKASLVWTSDRTRTYMFTEDCAESTSITDNSEATSPAGREDGKDVRSTMHVTLRVKQKSSTEEKRQVTNMVEAISDPQQQNNKSTNVEQGDKMTADFPPDDSVAKLPGLSSVYKGAFSTTLRKAFFKSNFLRRFWKILGFTITKTNIALQETALVNKDTENKCNNKSEDTEASVCFTTSQTLQEDGKKQPTSQRKPIMELVEGNQHEVLKNALHKDIEACSSCATCESLQENGENKPMKQCEVLENLQEKREQQPVLERKSTWRLLEGKQCEVHKDMLLTLLLSRVGEDPSAKEVWRNTGFTDELWKEVISYFISEGGRFPITRTTTMDELIKILTESNLNKVAQLQEDELFQLAKFLYGEILILAQNQDVGNSESKVESKPMEGGANGKTMLEGQNVSDASMRSEVGHSRDSEVTADAAVEGAQNVKIKDDSMLFRASKGRKSSSAAEQGLCEAAVLKDLKEMVVELLQSCKDGLPLGSVKPAFKKRYGYELNNKVLGHTSLASLLRTLEGVMISKENDESVVAVSSSQHSVHECEENKQKKASSVGNICQVNKF